MENNLGSASALLPTKRGEADLAYIQGRRSGWLGYGGMVVCYWLLRGNKKHGGRMCVLSVLYGLDPTELVSFRLVHWHSLEGGCILRSLGLRGCVFSVFADKALGRIGARGLGLFLLLVRSFFFWHIAHYLSDLDMY